MSFSKAEYHKGDLIADMPLVPEGEFCVFGIVGFPTTQITLTDKDRSTRTQSMQIPLRLYTRRQHDLLHLSQAVSTTASVGIQMIEQSFTSSSDILAVQHSRNTTRNQLLRS
jgi:hypothetical protein